MKIKSFLFLGLVLSARASDSTNRPVGLQNCGNTCYFDSILQVLYNTDDLTNALLGTPASPIQKNPYLKEPGQDGPFGFDYVELIRNIRTRTGVKDYVYDPCKFVERRVWKKNGDNQDGSLNFDYGEQDAEEAFEWIIQKLRSDDVSDNRSLVRESILKKVSFTKVTSSEEEPNHIILGLPVIEGGTSQTIEDCLEKFMGTEPNKTQIKNIPANLFIRLNRFTYTTIKSTGKSTGNKPVAHITKIETEVTVGEYLDIKEFVTTDADRNQSCYELVGVVYHRGDTIASGHYLAYIKNEGGWWQCNDTSISETPLDFNDETFKKERNTAYVYAYKRMSEDGCKDFRAGEERERREAERRLEAVRKAYKEKQQKEQEERQKGEEARRRRENAERKAAEEEKRRREEEEKKRGGDLVKSLTDLKDALNTLNVQLSK